MRPLSDVIEGETAAEFQARVEVAYSYSIQPGERWVLYGDRLIVVHPDRAPIVVHEGGLIETITPYAGPLDTSPQIK
jgi:hypothetical protein